MADEDGRSAFHRRYKLTLAVLFKPACSVSLGCQLMTHHYTTCLSKTGCIWFLRHCLRECYSSSTWYPDLYSAHRSTCMMHQPRVLWLASTQALHAACKL